MAAPWHSKVGNYNKLFYMKLFITDTMQVPPVGVRFRILTVKNDKMFKPRGKASEGVEKILLDTSNTRDYNYDDGTWFTLQSSGISNFYRICNVKTNRRLSAREHRHRPKYDLRMLKYESKSPKFRLTDPTNTNNELWTLNFSNDNHFHLLNFDGGTLAASENDGLCIEYHKSSKNHQILLLYFFLEEYEISNVNFELDTRKIVSKIPKSLATQTMVNSTSLKQEQKCSFRYTNTRKHRFQYTGGFKIEAGARVSFKGGIPILCHGDLRFKLGLQTEYNWTNETVETESEVINSEFPVKVPPRTTLSANVIITEETVEVPYTMKLLFKSSGVEVESHGKWLGTQYVNVETVISETEKKDNRHRHRPRCIVL